MKTILISCFLFLHTNHNGYSTNYNTMEQGLDQSDYPLRESSSCMEDTIQYVKNNARKITKIGLASVLTIFCFCYTLNTLYQAHLYCETPFPDDHSSCLSFSCFEKQNKSFKDFNDCYQNITCRSDPYNSYQTCMDQKCLFFKDQCESLNNIHTSLSVVVSTFLGVISSYYVLHCLTHCKI